MLVKTLSAALNALDAIAVTIEVNTSRGMNFSIVGLPDNAVKESRERMITAINNSGMHYPLRNTVINMAPADVKKEGASYDLPIAIAILAANDTIRSESLENVMLIGELGLDGTVRPVRGILSIAILARKMEIKSLFVPKDNAREASVVNNLKVYGVSNLRELVDFLNGVTNIEPTETDTRTDFFARQNCSEKDFSDVKGQQAVKRALEVAAAGGHNIIMVGPPGSGKTMMAQRIPSILPPLSLKESLETTQIYSIANCLTTDGRLIVERPYRSPHHTSSQVALCGGGVNARPGEICLAHNGVLFCDELPEFPRATLEALRQPLEDRVVNISRAKYTVQYPCSFMLVAAMNPCPCGYYNDPRHECTCTPGQIQRYMGKISGPLLDRIDIQCDILPIGFEDISISAPSESSEEIRKRVLAARAIQAERYKDYMLIHCNAQMTEKMLHQYAEPDSDGLDLLKGAMERFKLSARAYNRILKVARTIADLEGCDKINSSHLSEAINYRQLDRGDRVGR